MNVVAAEASGDEKAFRLQTEVQDAKLERKIRVAVWDVLSGSKNNPKNPLLPLLPKEILIPESLLPSVRLVIADVLKGTGHGDDYVIHKVPLEEDPHLNVYKQEEPEDVFEALGYRRKGSSRRTRAGSYSRRSSASSSHRSKRKTNGRRNRSDDPPF